MRVGSAPAAVETLCSRARVGRRARRVGQVCQVCLGHDRDAARCKGCCGTARAAPALRLGSDAGSAVVEFVAVSLLLLVPVVYLVVAMARVQAATFAVESAAREAARVVATASTPAEAEARALAATRWALTDQGFDVPAEDALALDCTVPGCLAPGARVTATVSVVVALPGVPELVSGAVPVGVSVSASHAQVVDEFRELPP